MKIIAEIFRLPSGSLLPQLYAVKDNGEVDRGVTDTLLDFISELFPPADQEFISLLSLAGSGEYVPSKANLADWSVNDKFVWLTPPMAERGMLCIANDNVPEYSVDDGTPQQFSVSQFEAALAHWKHFQELLRESGRENLVGKKFEVVIS